MGVPLLDLKAQYATIKDEVVESVMEVLDSQYFILGPKVLELEEKAAGYSDCGFGVGVSSGTDALLISLMAAGINEGDEVITTPYSFFATAGSVVRAGAIPVFVDIDLNSYNIDPAKIESVITDRTKAILPVHLYGQVADMDPIMEIAKKHNLVVIEDAAQAIGAEYKGKRAGSFGDYGCFSFFPSKNLGGAGDGGMVVTRDSEIAERLKILRNHGAKPKYFHKTIGGNFRLDAIQAAVLMIKLKYLDSWTEGRQKNAENYRNLFRETGLVLDQCDSLKGIKGLILPEEEPDVRHIYNQFVIRIDKRDLLREFLKERGIGNEVYYPVPFHLQRCFANLGYKIGEFPLSETAAMETIALPVYPEMTIEMQREVVLSVKDYINRM